MGSERQIGSTNSLSRSLLDLCRMRKLTIATAESCTGGLVAGALTDIPGSSDVIDRGFVTYSNEAKRVMLGVKATTLAAFGAVSRETATAMAVGALERAGVDLAVATTGIAGPGGATPGKPAKLAQDITFAMWTQPAVTYLSLDMSHGIHHRGQLSAYLRPMGAKVPSIYGPSADEPLQAAATE